MWCLLKKQQIYQDGTVQLGYGSHASVVGAVHATGALLAVKVFKQPCPFSVAHSARMGVLGVGPHVWYADEAGGFVVMDRYTMTLGAYLNQSTMTRAMVADLHTRLSIAASDGYCWTDLKLDNVVITPTTLELRLIDFDDEFCCLDLSPSAALRVMVHLFDQIALLLYGNTLFERVAVIESCERHAGIVDVDARLEAIAIETYKRQTEDADVDMFMREQPGLSRCLNFYKKWAANHTSQSKLIVTDLSS
jgi:hypothetical protein